MAAALYPATLKKIIKKEPVMMTYLRFCIALSTLASASLCHADSLLGAIESAASAAAGFSAPLLETSARVAAQQTIGAYAGLPYGGCSWGRDNCAGNSFGGGSGGLSATTTTAAAAVASA